MENILNEIQNILRSYKGQPNLTINDETKLVELELDSLDTVDLIMEIEERMNVVLIEKIKEVQTMAQLVELIEAQIG
jgi:acyl carrier protein